MCDRIVAKALKYKKFEINYFVYKRQNRYAAKATIPIQLLRKIFQKEIELIHDYLILYQAEAAIILASKKWIDDYVELFDY